MRRSAVSSGSAKAIEAVTRQLNALDRCSRAVREQAKRVLTSATIAAGAGGLFLLAAAVSLLLPELENWTRVILIAGIVFTMAAVVFFYLHRKTLADLVELQNRLDARERVEVAINLFGDLEASDRRFARFDLFRAITGLGMAFGAGPVIGASSKDGPALPVPSKNVN